MQDHMKNFQWMGKWGCRCYRVSLDPGIRALVLKGVGSVCGGYVAEGCLEVAPSKTFLGMKRLVSDHEARLRDLEL